MITKDNQVVKVPYGISHTKKYTKSLVADFLVERDKDSNMCTFINDINLLLRQKSLHRTIGVDHLRNYVEQLEQKQPERHNFTDEELFKMIEPKSVNNLTTGYEYARYLQENSDKMKDAYKRMKKEKDAFERYMKKYKDDNIDKK